VVAPEPRCARCGHGAHGTHPCPGCLMGCHKPAPEPSGRMSDEKFERIALKVNHGAGPAVEASRLLYAEARRARASEDALREALRLLRCYVQHRRATDYWGRSPGEDMRDPCCCGRYVFNDTEGKSFRINDTVHQRLGEFCGPWWQVDLAALRAEVERLNNLVLAAGLNGPPSEWPTRKRVEELISDRDNWKRYAGAEIGDLKARTEKAEAERDEARDWVRKMHRENQILTCIYCGHSYPPGTPASGSDVLTAHIKTCEKHPLRKAEARIATLEAALGGVSHDRQFGPCWCNTIAGLYCVGQDECKAAAADLTGKP
jgi:hypothetical protein